MTDHACTIVARNYVPYARVLARSFLEHHPGGSLTTLIIDDVNCDVDAEAEPFDVFRLKDLDIAEDEVHRMAMIYDRTELATALKPWLLDRLSKDHTEGVLYLDPDIRVFSSLSEVSSLARDHGIVLTPHATAPMPRDGLMTEETSILAAGIYNLGFIGVGPDQSAFLEFWKERLRRECIVEPNHMRFVDQRWIDFVPGMFSTYILQDTTCNVAYWNLDHRNLRWAGSHYDVDGRPLKFFHFSGYTPRAPHLLSKHQGERPRILLSDRPDLAKLCNEYRIALEEAGYWSESDATYGFARMANGVVIDPLLRHLYREELLRSEELGAAPIGDVFSAEGARAFCAWLNEVDHSGGVNARLTRYLDALYRANPDLHGRFVDPHGRDFARFMEWAALEVRAGRIHPELADISPRAGGARTPTEAGQHPRALRPGIRVAGYLRAEMGVGQLGRLATAVVEATGIPCSTYVYDRTSSRQNHPFVENDSDEFNVNLICVNADELPGFAAAVGPDFFQGKYTIGLWAWELDTFPAAFSPAFDVVDEVWAISDFVRHAVASATTKPVLSFPLPVIPSALPTTTDLDALGLPQAFTFLFCFDLLSIFERKNPLGLVDAFSRAFEDGEGPVLVIKAINGEMRRGDLERLRSVAATRTDVVILDHYLGYGENAALMNHCDCYVSLHRSEGFGLTMAEAMALGKPVIATAYSGNLEFMDGANSLLVPWRPGTVPAGCDPYPQGSMWAEPEIDAAARLMRSVYDDRGQALETGRKGQLSVLENHGVHARTAMVSARFAEAQRSLSTRPGHAPSDGGVRRTMEPPGLSDIAVSTAPIDAPSRYPWVARFFRRLVRRSLRHHDEHQRQVNLAMAEAVSELTVVIEALVRRSQFETPDNEGQIDECRRRIEELATTVAELAAYAKETGLEARIAHEPEQL